MNKIVKLLVSCNLGGYWGNLVAALITCNLQEKNFFNPALVDMYIIEADCTVGTFNNYPCTYMGVIR